VKCIYYDIGCTTELNPSDVSTHEQTHHAEHTRLIYMRLTNCENELLISNIDINTLKRENIALKQDNVLLKQDTSHLKQQVKTIKTELQQVKSENRKLIGKSNHVEMNKCIEIDIETSEPVHKKSKKEVNNIDDLKGKLLMARTLGEKVSLVSNDKVMIIKKCNTQHIELNTKCLSHCYKENQFQNMFDPFDLNDESVLMTELLNTVPYHFYVSTFYGRQRYRLVFPLDLQNIKDIEIIVPDKFKLNIVDNELVLEVLHQHNRYSFLFIENHELKLEHKEKFNLQRLERNNLITYAPGYAFLDQFTR